MRVLLLHQYYAKLRGAFNVMLGVESSLARLGHESIVFASRTAASADAPNAAYFPEGFTRSELGGSSILRKTRLALNGIYSLDARRGLRGMVASAKPDVAIVFRPEYQLSYSVLSELHELGIPTALWIVDYRFWCTEGFFFNHAEREPCYRCAGGAHWNAIRYRCGEGSLPLSAYGTSVRLVSHTMLSLERLVDLYVVPCEATRNVLVERAGIVRSQVETIPHPMTFSEFPDDLDPPTGDYAVYYGLIAEHKAVGVLIDALTHVDRMKLEVYGLDSMGLAERMRTTVRQRSLENRVTLDTELRFGPALSARLRGALCIVAPSQWSDTLEYTVLESMALGKAVIVADRGCNREFVERAGAGLVVRAGDPADLARALSCLAAAPGEAKAMGLRGRAFVRANLAEAKFDDRITALLARVTGAIRQ